MIFILFLPPKFKIQKYLQKNKLFYAGNIKFLWDNYYDAV